MFILPFPASKGAEREREIMSKTKKRAMIESDSDDSGSSDLEQVCTGYRRRGKLEKGAISKLYLQCHHYALRIHVCSIKPYVRPRRSGRSVICIWS